MISERNRVVERCSWWWSTGACSFPSDRAGRRRSAAFVAALAVTMLMLTAAPAVASPAPETPTCTQEMKIPTPPGSMILIHAEGVCENVGTNARFTSVVFSHSELFATPYWEEETGLNEDHHVVLKMRNTEQLSALASRPPRSFTVTATVTMTNDEGDTATATVIYETTWSST